jgi:hypothetical protein
MPESRIDWNLGLVKCLRGFQDDGESRNWREVAEEGAELGEIPKRRGREGLDVEIVFEFPLDDLDMGRGGVKEDIAIETGRG